MGLLISSSLLLTVLQLLMGMTSVGVVKSVLSLNVSKLALVSTT